VKAAAEGKDTRDIVPFHLDGTQTQATPLLEYQLGKTRRG